MITRRLTSRLQEALSDNPAVAMLGPRQSGKTTLALAVGEQRNALYLDLESEADQAKIAQPELYLADHADRLVILDEVHRAPGLFPVLRGLIDRGRRSGRSSGRFLLLGSASLDLLKQSGETLAGRIAYLELGPIDALETRPLPLRGHRLRGHRARLHLDHAVAGRPHRPCRPPGLGRGAGRRGGIAGHAGQPAGPR